MYLTTCMYAFILTALIINNNPFQILQNQIHIESREEKNIF